jgi:hypothetical protein
MLSGGGYEDGRYGGHEKEDISMSRWPLNGKFPRIATALLLVLSCMLLFQACSADCSADPDITGVCLSVDPGIMCEDNEFIIYFHSWTGLQAPTNGFWVFFEDDVIIPTDISEDCVEIKWDCCTWTHPYQVQYYSESALPSFAPVNASQAVKIWISESIPHNQDVWIRFDCLNVLCPLDCQGFMVWVNNDIQRCPQPSNCVYMKVKVIASAGPDGTIKLQPSGPTAPPTFNTTFDCGATPSYLITADECHVIDTIDVTPLCCCVPDPAPIVYNNGTTQATYQFDPLDCSYEIHATFKSNRVYAFLKYQLPKSECGDIVKVKIWGSDDIQPVLDFTDSLWQSGNSSNFTVMGVSSGTEYAAFSGGVYTPGASYNYDTLFVNVTDKPDTNPETYAVTYKDTDGKEQFATVTILLDGASVWAPYVPDDVSEVTNIIALQPAWKMVTQDYLDCNPAWEGLVGVVVQVDDGDDGIYDENIVIDTPGVHLKNKDGTSPTIDGSVFLSAGCTGIEGFTITNSDTNGILVEPSSWKCEESWILDCQNACPVEVPCCKGRINIVDNNIYGNDDNGIRVKNAVVLISHNEIHENGDDGIDAGCLFCGVECIDPEAITHSPACSEIIYNMIYSNGPSNEGEWEVYNETDGKYYFTTDPTACDTLKGWTDAGIQIRCVGSSWCESEPCCQCESPIECISCNTDSSDLVSQQVDDRLCGGCNQSLYIVNNDITANYHAGIYLMNGATQGGNITIQGNQLHENGIFGMLTEAEYPCRIDFRCNNIWCNTYWGVKNLACCDLIAKENYWGSPGGPSEGPAPIVKCIEICHCHEIDQRSDALGNGDAVSHKVHYNPWLYDWACDDGACGTNPCGPIRIYGSDSLLLQCGWNTLSVPVMLADEGDTMLEIAGLGKFITPDNFIWILRWDATAGEWVDVGYEGETIAPGIGYYIKMTDDSRFPVLYNAGPSPGLVAVPLVSGWNLIGSPWGIDRDDGCCDLGDEGRWAVASPDLEDEEAFMQVTEALESIKEGNGGTKGVAIIVSPSVPGQYEIWSASVTSGFWDPIKNNHTMVTGDAYWVFMVNPSTYAGFEITPFYFPST